MCVAQGHLVRRVCRRPELLVQRRHCKGRPDHLELSISETPMKHQNSLLTSTTRNIPDGRLSDETFTRPPTPMTSRQYSRPSECGLSETGQIPVISMRFDVLQGARVSLAPKRPKEISVDLPVVSGDSLFPAAT
jgi:hypothetical protein